MPILSVRRVLDILILFRRLQVVGQTREQLNIVLQKSGKSKAESFALVSLITHQGEQ